MSWENQIRKYDVQAELVRASNILRKLRKEYNIKQEHLDGLDDLLFELRQFLGEKLQ